LVEIQSGKHGTQNGPSSYKHGRSMSFNPRSLNIAVRQREQDRIEKENHALAKKLFQNKASIRKSELDKFYEC